jgi:2-polyprenyl-3-methyl-5-hydroxy-6-metoxy-1,4-benzoquinol methylase
MAEKHLFTPKDLFELSKKLAENPLALKEHIADLWFVQGPRLKGCPYCASLLELFPESKKARILDCGCGNGNLIRMAYKAGYHNLTGVDHSKVGIAVARERCESALYFVGDFHYLYELDGLFDAIIFSEVLEHLSDDIEVLGEAKQKLPPSGYFVCSVPYKQQKLTVGHVRAYNENVLQERYSSIGRIDISRVVSSPVSSYKYIIFTIGRKV